MLLAIFLHELIPCSRLVSVYKLFCLDNIISTSDIHVCLFSPAHVMYCYFYTQFFRVSISVVQTYLSWIYDLLTSNMLT